MEGFEMGEVATIEHPPRVTAMAQTATEMRSHVQRIQQVMKAVMKDGVHYGKIPGAGDKRSLFKPGAEVLCAAFHIAPSFIIEDISDSDCVRLRVKCVGTHQSSGLVLGEGWGEASSSEEKYKWRNAVCDEEFEEWDAARKRVKWQKGYNNGKPFKRQQVRAEPDDIRNTVLKMACKRAQVHMAINVTAASDIFAQDLEDLPPGSVDPETGECDAPPQKPAPKAPQAAAGSGHNRCTQKQAGLILKRLDDSGVGAKDFCEQFGVAQVADLAFERVDEALRWIAEHAEAGARG
jgi:hypothetical protein